MFLKHLKAFCNMMCLCCNIIGVFFDLPPDTQASIFPPWLIFSQEFSGIVKQDPSQAALSMTELQASCLRTGEAQTLCNCFWFSLTYSPMSGVPIRPSLVKILVQTKFSKPAGVDFLLPVDPGRSGFFDDADKGFLPNLNPQENFHAMILSMFRDIKAGKENLKEWVLAALSCKCRAIRLDSKDFFFQAFIERQLLQEQAELHSLSAVTWLYQDCLVWGR